MPTNTNRKAAGAINTNGPYIRTNEANFRTVEALRKGVCT